MNQSVVSHHCWHQSSKVFPWIETTCSTFKKVPEKPWQRLPNLGEWGIPSWFLKSHADSWHPVYGLLHTAYLVCYGCIHRLCVCQTWVLFFAPVQLWLEWCWILTHLHLPINGHGSTLAYQWTRYMFDAWYSIWLAGKCSLKQRFEKGSCWTKFH